jgi:hypothetical protein
MASGVPPRSNQLVLRLPTLARHIDGMPIDAQPMPNPTRSGLKVLAVGLLSLAPVWYVVSAGPAAYLVVRLGSVTMPDYQKVYAPILATEQRLPPMARFMRWYRGLFVSQVVWKGLENAWADRPATHS